MFKINKFPFYIFLLTLFACSCKKDSEVFLIHNGNFGSSESLTASATDIVLSKSAENDIALTFTWAAADFGEKPVINYTLQLDVPSDTTGGWTHAKNFATGISKTYAFVTKDLNNLLSSMALAAGTPNDVVFRVKAEVPQYNGTISSVTPVYSNTVVTSITTYSENLYIPGGYQGWAPWTAPLLNPLEGRPGLYEAYIYTPGTGAQYFKYTSAPDWDHINYGDAGSGKLTTDGLAGGLNVPDGGYYEVTADLNTNSWTATKTTWGIIGDATPGGWDNDTQMSYDETNQVWTVTADMKANGSFKFRANNQWSIDFGMDPNTGKIVYADNPFYGYTAGLWNLSVPEDGNYTITLDLHISQDYTYKLVKN